MEIKQIPKSIEPSRSEQSGKYFEVTAYCLPGTTKSGTPVAPGVVAVDPAVIPLGTHIWIEGYGEAVALDTGKVIKGNRIDVWLPTKKECTVWGHKIAKVKILY